MANIIAGIKEVFFATGSAAFTDVTDADFGLGFRQTGQLIGEHFNLIEDHRTRQFPNLFNFRAEFSSMQLSVATLKLLIGYAQANAVSVAILTSGIEKVTTNVQPVSGEGNIFLFDNTDAMGIDWELLLTPTDRNISITTERAFGVPDSQTIITDSATAAMVFTPPGDKLPALSETLVSSGFLHPDFVDTGGVVVIPQIQLGDFRISLATKGNKNAFNISRVHSVHCEMEATMEGVDNAYLDDMVNHAFPSVDVDIILDGANKITIKALSVLQVGDLEIGDENRKATVKLQGDLDLDFVDVSGSDIIFNTYLL